MTGFDRVITSVVIGLRGAECVRLGLVRVEGYAVEIFASSNLNLCKVLIPFEIY